MKLSEVKEPGFYCSPGDTDRQVICEVYVNTSDDKEFVKNDPLLVDEWIYDYTKEDGNIKYYQTHGLVCRLYEYENVEVIKLDQKYKVEADIMWEDKPTYKEKLNQIRELIKSYDEELKSSEDYGDDYINGYDSAIIDYSRQLKEILND